MCMRGSLLVGTVAMVLWTIGCAGAPSPKLTVMPPLTQADGERIFSGCDAVAMGAVRARFPDMADSSSQAMKTGAGVIGGLAIISTAVVAIVLPPAAALIATGGALGAAGAAAGVGVAVDKQQQAQARGDERSEIYMAQLKACLAERGVALVEAAPASRSSDPR